MEATQPSMVHAARLPLADTGTPGELLGWHSYSPAFRMRLRQRSWPRRLRPFRRNPTTPLNPAAPAHWS